MLKNAPPWCPTAGMYLRGKGEGSEDADATKCKQGCGHGVYYETKTLLPLSFSDLALRPTAGATTFSLSREKSSAQLQIFLGRSHHCPPAHHGGGTSSVSPRLLHANPSRTSSAQPRSPHPREPGRICLHGWEGSMRTWSESREKTGALIQEAISWS